MTTTSLELPAHASPDLGLKKSIVSCEASHFPCLEALTSRRGQGGRIQAQQVLSVLSLLPAPGKGRREERI